MRSDSFVIKGRPLPRSTRVVEGRGPTSGLPHCLVKSGETLPSVRGEGPGATLFAEKLGCQSSNRRRRFFSCTHRKCAHFDSGYGFIVRDPALPGRVKNQ